MTVAWPYDGILEQATAILAEGPMPLEALVDRLDRGGHLDALRAECEAGEDLAEAVGEVLLYTDDTWSTPDNLMGLSAQLTDGMVLTHRLARHEVETGQVLLTPDLVVLDWDDDDALELEGGGPLAHQSHGVHIPGEDSSGLAGPEGWLDVFAPGRPRRLHPQGPIGAGGAGRDIRRRPPRSGAAPGHHR